ncbi:MAG: hypothetical protein BWZ02_02063 [Lentisphaerae bacterium ADurb.BinA184]|nr:MAG: hypothetical protein BWZ02_02063 [Lentisphaerae bacterium ADurb.BinA184]
MQYVTWPGLTVSRFILGSNPFSGFSHQGTAADQAMRHYFTTETIKRTLHEAEAVGVNTLLARTDHHVMRVLLEYWDQGGRLQWFAQTCPEVGNHEACVSRAASGGAKACHIHGGVMDHLFAQGKLDEIPAVIRMIREHGMLAGVAAHNPDVLRWVEANTEVDYYMCSYYNPIPRVHQAEHVSGTQEVYLEADRRAMTALIPTLSKPAIHYKVLAAGRNPPAEAFARVAAGLRVHDAVCVGVYTEHAPDMVREDVGLLESALRDRKTGTGA